MTTEYERPALRRWLDRMESSHSLEIDLGLARVRTVCAAAGLDKVPCPVITVAGTNGKGSTVAFLTAMYKSAGYQVGAYTSPHIRFFNERICINGTPCADELLVAALNAIEEARSEVTLSYFEYSTLAAMQLFVTSDVDIIILEVGLGGRLDAVNIWDADVAVVTSIAIDHESWLGNTREQILVEKLGVARKNHPLIFADINPPSNLLQETERIGATLYCIQRDFDYSQQGGLWDFSSQQLSVKQLTEPKLKGEWQYHNASAAIIASVQLQDKLPLQAEHYQAAMINASITGRFQLARFKGHPVILDVGHNPSANRALLAELRALYPDGLRAVFAVMQDKAVKEMLTIMMPVVRAWYLGDIDMSRAMPAGDVVELLDKLDKNCSVKVKNNIVSATEQAIKDENAGLPVLIFGSFYTVAEIAEYIN